MKFFVATLTASILAKPNAFKRKTSEERKTERKAGKQRNVSFVHYIGNELNHTCQKYIDFWGNESIRIGKVTSVDNGKSGSVSLEWIRNFSDGMKCHIPVGQQCNEEGVHIELIHLAIEGSDPDLIQEWIYTDDFGYDYVAYNPAQCYRYGDYIKFAYHINGKLYSTNGQCGCLDENHESCNDPNFQFFETIEPTEYDLIGTDVSMTFLQRPEPRAGKVAFNWTCRSELNRTKATNAVTMAEVVLTGDFTPEMARDYGCGGRGYFNAYRYFETHGVHDNFAGYYVDETDVEFYRWKKCVRCASRNSATNAMRLYEYDPDTDTCGGVNRAVCECDRLLMNYLKDLPATSNNNYPLANCSDPQLASYSIGPNVGPHTGGSSSSSGGAPAAPNKPRDQCCNWDTWKWAEYSPRSQCCGVDGVKPIGTC